MQDKSTQEILVKANQSKTELPIVEERIEVLKAGVMKKLSSTKEKTDLEIRNLCQALQIADMVLEYLIINIDKSKLANAKIDDIQKVGSKPTLVEKAKRFLP